MKKYSSHVHQPPRPRGWKTFIGLFLSVPIIALLVHCTVDQPNSRPPPIMPVPIDNSISNTPASEEIVSKPVALPEAVPARPLPIPAPMPPKQEPPKEEPKEEPATPAPTLLPAPQPSPTPQSMNVTPTKIEIDLSTQTLTVYADHQVVKHYPISSSKYGIGSQAGSNKTPLGKHFIKAKIGDGAAENTIFQARANSGRIARINQEQGDLVTSRIMWLKEQDESDPNFAGANSSYRRFIYIHGTAAENNIGRPASHGCIRMYNKDVIELYDLVKEGLEVEMVCSQKNPLTQECQYDSVVASKMTQAQAADTHP